MQLLSLSCQVPPRSFSQPQVWAELEKTTPLLELQPSSRALLRKVLRGDSGIAERQLACQGLEELAPRDAGELNRVFEREATALAASSLRQALAEAHLLAEDLDALLVCTCTGYLCPGLSSYVAEACGLRRDAALVDLVGQGCGAALPLLRQGAGLLSLGARRVACVAVEICSAAFYLDDDPGVLISFCLFGDGAAASIWQGEEMGSSGVFVGDFRSLHWPEEREALRFSNERGKLRNILAPSVPTVAARAVATMVEAAPHPIGTLLLHPGGRRVLEAVMTVLPEQPLRESWQVLRAHGNMSSPSVLFALAEWLKPASPGSPIFGEPPDAPHATMVSFGAGFTCYSASVHKRCQKGDF